jgi:hypothetical protein
MTENLALNDFAACAGESFRLDLEPGRSLELVLESAEELQAPAGYEVFALLFSSAGQTPLPQRIYRLAHARLGAFDLFLVPVDVDGRRCYYEAVFNRRQVQDRQRPGRPKPS